MGLAVGISYKWMWTLDSVQFLANVQKEAWAIGLAWIVAACTGLEKCACIVGRLAGCSFLLGTDVGVWRINLARPESKRGSPSTFARSFPLDSRWQVSLNRCCTSFGIAMLLPLSWQCASAISWLFGLKHCRSFVVLQVVKLCFCDIAS